MVFHVCFIFNYIVHQHLSREALSSIQFHIQTDRERANVRTKEEMKERTQLLCERYSFVCDTVIYACTTPLLITQYKQFFRSYHIVTELKCDWNGIISSVGTICVLKALSSCLSTLCTHTHTSGFNGLFGRAKRGGNHLSILSVIKFCYSIIENHTNNKAATPSPKILSFCSFRWIISIKLDYESEPYIRFKHII